MAKITSITVFILLCTFTVSIKPIHAVDNPEIIQWKSNANVFAATLFQGVFGQPATPQSVQWVLGIMSDIDMQPMAYRRFETFWRLISSSQYRNSRWGKLDKDYFVYFKSMLIDTNRGRRPCNCYYYAEFSDGLMPSMQLTGARYPAGKFTASVARAMVRHYNAFDRESCKQDGCGYGGDDTSSSHPISPPQSPSGQNNLIGSWEGCDGRVVTFSFENGQYVGRYTQLGRLGQYNFALNEVGYVAKKRSDGQYIGKVKWKWKSGKHEWRPSTITITGDKYTDTGSDSCSSKMSKTGSMQLPPQSPSGQNNLIGSWGGCDGRVVTFSIENGQYIGRYTQLGRLGQYNFVLNEVGYVVKKRSDGQYIGKVKWKWKSGKHEWRPTTITITGNKYTDTGSDSCSSKMRKTGSTRQQSRTQGSLSAGSACTEDNQCAGGICLLGVCSD